MFTRAIRLRANPKTLNTLQQHGVLQKRNQHFEPFSEEHYQEISKIENTENYPYNIVCKAYDAGSEEEKQGLMAVWPEVVESFVNGCTDIPEFKQHLATLLQENVCHSKQASGMLTVTAYKAFEAPEKISPETIKQANILGWCVNMMLSTFLLTDDIMDSTEMRYGKPSWHTMKNIGLAAIMDAATLENGIYLLLKKCLSENRSYFPIVEQFHDVAVKTAIGMFLDSKPYLGKRCLESFTIDYYKHVANYKKSHVQFVLPATVGMYLAGKYDSELHKLAKVILCELGLYFQVQNDVLDCYGHPAVTGRNATDITLGRCSWVIVEALQRATPAQKQILNEHYGKPERESEFKVLTLYNNLDMLNRFFLFEDQSFNRVCQGIQQMPKNLNKEFFRKTVETVYGRKIQCI